jgi:hypothetical protein
MITMSFVKFMKLKLKINTSIVHPTTILLHMHELLHLLVELHGVTILQLKP